MEIFMLVVGIGIGAATLVIVQALVKARDDNEEQRVQVAELKTLLDVERMRLDQMSGEIERTNVRADKAAAAHFDDHGLVRKFASDAQAMRVDMERAIDVMGEAILQQEGNFRTIRDDFNKHQEYVHNTLGELDLRQQFLKDDYVSTTTYLNSVDVNIGVLADRLDTLEARVAHRRRKPKEANPTDGTTENDPVISAGDLIPLNPGIFKEVNSSFTDE